jgi:hypothetical protein
VRDIFAAAAELQQFCESQHWKFCFIGALALQRWGEPRATLDADLTLLTGFGGEEKFVDRLLEKFRGRRTDAREFALQKRVVLLIATSGVPLDIALGALPFEENSVRRASPWTVSTCATPLITCSAEDLIVHKAFAARAQDWADIERVVMRQGRKLNLDQIWSELRPLVAAKEQPGILTQLQSVFDQSLDD